MSWEKGPLFTKARLFFEKAFQENQEESYFGLWCAMGLELLARSAVSHFSPTLLAEPEKNQSNLLYALNLGSSKDQHKSIVTSQVLLLCKELIKEFTESDYKIASAIINRRNEELHSGSAAFGEYATQQWIAGFYRCCKILSEVQQENLTSLLGNEIAEEAQVLLDSSAEETIGKTNSAIAAHKKVFDSKSLEVQEKLREDAKINSEKLSYKGYHRVECPACQCVATVLGDPYGKKKIEHIDDEIIVRQSILPTIFNCNACELKLTGYYALSAAKVGNYYTRKISYSPEDYYNLINPDDDDAIAERYKELHPDEVDWDDEWNNE